MIKIDSKTFYKDDYEIYRHESVGWHCECLGFTITRNCKHIKEAKTL